MVLPASAKNSIPETHFKWEFIAICSSRVRIPCQLAGHCGGNPTCHRQDANVLLPALLAPPTAPPSATLTSPYLPLNLFSQDTLRSCTALAINYIFLRRQRESDRRQQPKFTNIAYTHGLPLPGWGLGLALTSAYTCHCVPRACSQLAAINISRWRRSQLERKRERLSFIKSTRDTHPTQHATSLALPCLYFLRVREHI